MRVSTYGDSIDCAFQSQSSSVANEIMAAQDYALDCINVFALEWPIGGDVSTGLCPSGMEYCFDPKTVNPIMRRKWDFLVSRTYSSIRQVSLHISWSCLFLYCSIVHTLESLPATSLEVETTLQFPMYMPRCMKDEEKQAAVLLATVESVLKKASYLEHVTVRGSWITNVDCIWRMKQSGQVNRLHEITIMDFNAELQPYHTSILLGEFFTSLPGLKRLTVICSTSGEVLENGSVSVNLYIAFVLCSWQSAELSRTSSLGSANTFTTFSIHFKRSEYMTVWLDCDLQLTRM